MGKAADYVSYLNERISNAIKRIEPYKAFVHAPKVENGKVQIITVGADTADAEPYARLLGPAVYGGEQVAVINLGGKPFVLGKIQDSLNEWITFDGPVQINGDLYPAADVNAYGNVTASSFNSPRFDARTDTSATVPNTTTLNTWFEHGSYVHNLPAGTWTVYAFSMQRVVHSAGSTVYTRTLVNGTGGTITSSNANASGDWIASSAVATGITGSATISCEYQNRVAGTAAVGYATMIMMAVRTA